LPALPKRGRVKQRDLSILTRELATLISAGLPLDRALSVLSSLTDKEELKRTVGQILRAVQQGKSLAEALAEYPKIFPPLYVNMVKAGEVGGFLDTVLQRLAEYLERAQEVQDEIKSALAYPVILVIVGGVSVFFMFTYVLPKFAVIFADLGSALPAPTRLLLAISHGLRSYWWALPLVGVGAWVGMRQYLATPQGRFTWDRLRLRVVVLGPLLLKREVARFARTLGTLLKSGVPLLQGLEVVEAVVGNLMISRALKEVRVGVREGQGIAGPLGRSGVFPTLALQMVSVGEETGRLDEMLMRVAEYYERETYNQLRRLVSLVEPLLIVLMGLVVGFIVMAMLLGIFSMNDLPF
jgi:general secretion pathway protein F